MNGVYVYSSRAEKSAKSINSQIVNIWDFVASESPQSQLLYCLCSKKAAREDRKQWVWLCPNKSYFQKQAVARTGISLPTHPLLGEWL